MSDRRFVDTNVLVYLFDVRDPTRRERARHIIGTEGAKGTLVVSTQVLLEVWVTLTRKLKPPIDPETATAVIRTLTAWPIVSTDTDLVMRAMERSRESNISLWDALIVEAARVGGCDTVYSEDLQDGGRYGEVRVVNPFSGLA